MVEKLKKALEQYTLDLGSLPTLRDGSENLGSDGKKRNNDWPKGGKREKKPETKVPAKESWTDGY